MNTNQNILGKRNRKNSPSPNADKQTKKIKTNLLDGQNDYRNHPTLICNKVLLSFVNEDGNLVVWKNNNQFKNYDDTIPYVIHLPDIKYISCMNETIFCLCSNGEFYKVSLDDIETYGYKINDKLPSSSKLATRLKPLDILPPIKQISSSENVCFLLTCTGELYVLGKNIHGLLGLNKEDTSCSIWMPTKIESLPSKVEIIECSNDGVICKLENGEFYAWGLNQFKKLCIKDNGILYKDIKNIEDLEIHAPEKCFNIPKDVISIKLNYNNSFFLTSDGKLYIGGLEKKYLSNHFRVYPPFKIILCKKPLLIDNLPFIDKLVCSRENIFLLDNKGFVWTLHTFDNIKKNNSSEVYRTCRDYTQHYDLTMKKNENLDNIIDISAYSDDSYFAKTNKNQIYFIGNTRSLLPNDNNINSSSSIPVEIIKKYNKNLWRTNKK